MLGGGVGFSRNLQLATPFRRGEGEEKRERGCVTRAVLSGECMHVCVRACVRVCSEHGVGVSAEFLWEWGSPRCDTQHLI